MNEENKTKKSYPPLMSVNGNITNLKKVNGFVIATIAINRKNGEKQSSEFLPIFLKEDNCIIDSFFKDGKEEVNSIKYKTQEFTKGSWIHIDKAPVGIQKPSEYNNVVKPQIRLFEPKEIYLNNPEAKIIEKDQLEVKGFVRNISLSKDTDGNVKGLNVAIQYVNNIPEQNLSVNVYINKEEKRGDKVIQIFNENDIELENNRIKSVNTSLPSGTLSLNNLMTIGIRKFTEFNVRSFETKDGTKQATGITTFYNSNNDKLTFKDLNRPKKEKEIVQERTIEKPEQNIQEEKNQEIEKNQKLENELDGYPF